MEGSGLTCDAVKRDSDGHSHRHGVAASWAIHQEGGAFLYLCDECFERKRRAGGAVAGAKPTAQEAVR